MPIYHARFQDGHEFDVDVLTEAFATANLTVATAMVYRPASNGHPREVLHRSDGGPMEFTAVGESAALDLACTVLSTLYGTRLESLQLLRTW